jgi:membrane complex biogenesis BtpA family protein
VASVAIAGATGASFAREIFTGLFASDMGLWQPNAANAHKLRTEIGRKDLKHFYNINAEFAASLDTRPIELRARSAVFSSLADAILVSGPLTGQPAAAADLRKVAETVKEVPVFANTGVNLDNVEDVLSVASGVIVGTSLKIDGNTWNAVDPARVKRFMDKVAPLV